MILLDADSLTLAYYRKPGITERVEAAQSIGEAAITLVTRIELLRGRFDSVIKAATAQELFEAQRRLAQTESFIAQFRVVPFAGMAADHFERLRAAKAVRKIDRGDLLIACIALAHDATLVTRNLKDYRLIPNLKLENWAD